MASWVCGTARSRRGPYQESKDPVEAQESGFLPKKSLNQVRGMCWSIVVMEAPISCWPQVLSLAPRIAVQLQPNDRFSNCVLLYRLYKLYCSGLLEEVHRGNDCSYTVCSDWWISYSPTVDYTAIFRHKLPNLERCVTLNNGTMTEPNICHSSGIWSTYSST